MISVHVDNLSKSFKRKKEPLIAVQGISFDVEKGELFGLIGPDGAGKTTLLRMLTTLLLPDRGSATVEGTDIVKGYNTIRRIVGYMPGRFSLYHDLSVEENLDFFATLFHTTVEENYHLIKDIYLQLEPFKTRKAGQLSGGMKQKLGLCCALIHRPEVLFLDEPTTGVDAVSRREFWEMLQRLKHQGITVLVSTPYMDEASQCDRVVLMQEGRVLSLGTPEAIRNSFTQTVLAIRAQNMFALLHDLSGLKDIDTVYTFGENHHAVMKGGFDSEKLKGYLEERNHTAIYIKPVQPTIEDCFMQLMRKSHE